MDKYEEDAGMSEKMTMAERSNQGRQSRAAQTHYMTQENTMSIIKIGSTGEHLPAEATDHAAVLYPNGLMVAVGAFDKEMTFKAAEKATATLEHAGATGWRLPTPAELVSLVDYSRYSPAADPSLYPDIQSDWYWTSQTCTWSLDRVWFVDFLDGSVDYNDRDNRAFCRPVRSLVAEVTK